MKEAFKEAVDSLKIRLSMIPNALLEGDNLTPTHEKFFENDQVRRLFLDAANSVNSLYEADEINAEEQERMSKDIVRILQNRMKNLGLESHNIDDVLCKFANTTGLADSLVDALVAPSLN